MNWKEHFSRLSGEGDATFGGFGDEPDPVAQTLMAVQQRLNAQGASPPLVVSGQLDAPTKAAILEFKSSTGRTPNSILDPALLNALGLDPKLPLTAPVVSGGAPAPQPTPTPATHPTTYTGAGQVEIPDKSTPMSPDDVIKALSAGYKKVVGKPPTPIVLNLMAAQSAFETGGWGKGIHNFNFGNSKSSNLNKYYQVFKANEGQDGSPAFSQKFAAFLNPADAGEHQVRILQSRPHWWDGLHSGTIDGFVKGLTTPPAYFTGNPAGYIAGMQRWAAKYLDLAAKYAVPGIGIAGILLAIAGGVVGFKMLQSARQTSHTNYQY